MKILYLRTSSMQCDPHVESVLELDKETKVFDYFTPDAHSKVIELAKNFNPTHVICLGANTADLTKDTFETLKKHAKIIYLIPEASHPDWQPKIEEYKNYIDLFVNLDGDTSWDPDKKHHTCLAIYGQKAYTNVPSWESRPVDVGFCGGPGFSGTMRQRLIDYLKDKNLITIFPFMETCGTYQQYADFMMSCKIIVNPAGSSGDKSKHVKGRVLEAGLAGCCLLEEVGSPIHHWFDSYSYYTFENEQNCEDEIKAILNLEMFSKATAKSLAKEVREKYSPQKMWNKIFEKVEKLG